MDVAKLEQKYLELRKAYLAWAQAHPWAAGMIVAAEAAVIGVVGDGSLYGIQFNRAGIKHAIVIIAGAVFIAVRNYLKQSPKQIAGVLLELPTAPKADAATAGK